MYSSLAVRAARLPRVLHNIVAHIKFSMHGINSDCVSIDGFCKIRKTILKGNVARALDEEDLFCTNTLLRQKKIRPIFNPSVDWNIRA